MAGSLGCDGVFAADDEATSLVGTGLIWHPSWLVRRNVGAARVTDHGLPAGLPLGCTRNTCLFSRLVPRHP